MPIEWIGIAAAVGAYLKTFAAERAKKAAEHSADGLMARMYEALMSGGKLTKINELFVLRFSKELDSSTDLPTLLSAPYRDSLKTFLCNPTVQDTIAAPLDGSTDLHFDLLRGIWMEMQNNGVEPLVELPGEFDWSRVGKTYSQGIRRLALADPNLRQLMQASATINVEAYAKETLAAVEQIAGAPRQLDLDRYAQAILGAFRCLRLGAFDAEWAAYQHGMRLENVYVAQTARHALPARDNLRDHLTGDRALRKKDESYENAAVLPLQLVLSDPRYNRLVLLGDPGLGKSTLLKTLALDWAKRRTGPVALYFELRRCSREAGYRSFLEYLERGPNRICCLGALPLHHLLQEEGGLFLLDGLDEVKAAARADTVADIIRLAEDYPKSKILVTTRIQGYHPGSTYPEQFRDANFEHFTLQDFDDPEIQRFVHLWHREAFADPAERRLYETRLRGAIEGTSSIRELAANPLLLTLMAILNRVQDLPSDRSLLYDRCAQLLLRNWDLDKFPELGDRRRSRELQDRLGPDQKMRILEQVAVSIQNEPGGVIANLIPEKTLKQVIQTCLEDLAIPEPWSIADDLIWVLRERNFMLAYFGGQEYGFIHRTFLEFFLARSIKDRLERSGTLSPLQLSDLFLQKWSEEEWNEPLRLLSGLVYPQRVGSWLTELLDQQLPNAHKAAVFAAQCIREVHEVGLIRDVRQRCKTAMLRLLAYRPPYLSTQTEEVEPSEVDEEAYIIGIRVQALQELARGWREDSDVLDALRILAVQAEYALVRETAAREVATGWRDDPETLIWLRECSRGNHDGTGVLRGAAIAELVRGWPDDLEAQAITRAYVARETHAARWSVVIDTLGSRASLSADHLRMVVCRVNDSSPAMRIEALRALGRWWQTDSESVSVVTARAKGDIEKRVREQALDQLADSWPDAPGTKALLTDALLDDDDRIRQTALSSMLRNLSLRPSNSDILKQLMENDPNAIVQSVAAVLWMSDKAKDRAAFQELLKQRAAKDPSEEVRGLTIKLLGILLPKPDLMDFLRQRAILDKSAAIKRIALTVIASAASGDLSVVAWLKDLARTSADDDLKSASIMSLTKLAYSDSEFSNILELNVRSGNSHLRLSALQCMLLRNIDSPAVLEFLRKEVATPSEPEAARCAVVILSRNRSNAAVLALFRDVVSSAHVDSVRIAALQGIALGWPDDDGTCELLLSYAGASSAALRAAALRALDELPTPRPEVISVLKSLARTDPAPDVRARAIWGLLWKWTGDDTVVPLLFDVVLKDKEADPKHAALGALGRLNISHAGLLAAVRTVIKTDPSPGVRIHAIRMLLVNDPPGPEIEALLNEAAAEDANQDVREVAAAELRRVKVN